jgi:hypothetical protein
MRIGTTWATVLCVVRIPTVAGWARSSPPVGDALLAVGLALLVQLEIWLTEVTVSKGLAVPAALLMTLPLAWRRRVPAAVTIVVMASWTGQSLLDNSPQPPQTAFLALLLACSRSLRMARGGAHSPAAA